MTKEELVHITLKQLIENLKASPENFRLEDPESGVSTNSSSTFHIPTIIWQHKFKLKEDQYIPDPLNASRTIIVTFNNNSKHLTCYIYFAEVNHIGTAINPETQAVVHCSIIPAFNRTYRQFSKIRKLLVQRHREKEFFDYMKKLNNIFPSTHEDDIFR